LSIAPAECLFQTGASAVEQIEQPSRPLHNRTNTSATLAQEAVGRHERHLTVRALGHGHEGVVATARSVDHSDPVEEPFLCAATSRTFEDHDHRFSESVFTYGSTNLVQERSSGAGPIPPPARWTRADHIRRIDEEHSSSLADLKQKFALGLQPLIFAER
jgi:hypothetical protein